MKFKIKKSTKEMIIAIMVFSVLLTFLQENIKSNYSKYKATTDAYKEQCLAKFKTIEYEVVNEILYCKSVNGLVKFNKASL